MQSIKNKKRWNKKWVFYICAVSWSVVQFLVFYVFVNFNSILLSFREMNYYKHEWQFAGLKNFKQVFDNFSQLSYMRDAFKNTFMIFGIHLLTMFVPIVLSYYIFKKYPMHELFKVFLFLPSVVSSIVLVLCYKYFVEVAIPDLSEIIFHREMKGLLSNPDTKWGTLIFYSVWIGMGGSFLLYLGAVSGISDSILEAGELDGVNPIQEFVYIVFPMIYPTFVTFMITGFATIFTNQLNLFTFYGEKAEYAYYTVGYLIYAQVRTAAISEYPYYAALGLVLTAIAVPLCLGTKWLLNKIGPKTV